MRDRHAEHDSHATANVDAVRDGYTEHDAAVRAIVRFARLTSQSPDDAQAFDVDADDDRAVRDLYVDARPFHLDARAFFDDDGAMRYDELDRTAVLNLDPAVIVVRAMRDAGAHSSASWYVDAFDAFEHRAVRHAERDCDLHADLERAMR